MTEHDRFEDHQRSIYTRPDLTHTSDGGYDDPNTQRAWTAWCGALVVPVPDDAQVDRMLSAVIPGGSQARDWFLPHETVKGLTNVRDVVRAMLSAAPQPQPVQQEPRHPSFEPFKCPVCRSSCFGPIWKGSEHVGRYCKGWPSRWDRSYDPCKGNYEEFFPTGVATKGGPT